VQSGLMLVTMGKAILHLAGAMHFKHVLALKDK
jgi:hypothetical protein